MKHSTVESGPARRLTKADEAYLRRYRNEMKFAGAGTPRAPLLDHRVGRRFVSELRERYTPDSPERYDVAAAIGEDLTRELGVRFGSNAVVTNRPKRRPRPTRRRRGGGRRVAA